MCVPGLDPASLATYASLLTAGTAVSTTAYSAASVLPVLSAVVGVGSATTGFALQHQQSDATERAAYMGYGQTATGLAQQASQIDAQQTENRVEAAIARSAAQGRLSNSLSSMGVTGATATAQTSAVDNQVGRAISIQDLNSQNARVQNAYELQGAALQRDSRIASTPRPSPIQLALGIGEAGLQATSLKASIDGKLGKPAGSRLKALPEVGQTFAAYDKELVHGF